MTAAIGLELERLISGTVSSNANVIFETVVKSFGPVSYNSTTGVITINQSGRYYINWWVATQSAFGANFIKFSLRTSQGDDIAGASPIKTGEVVGVALIQVDTAPVEVSLVNTTTTDVAYGTLVTDRAHLVITQEIQDALLGATGATEITGPTGPTGAAGSSNLAGMYLQNSSTPTTNLPNDTAIPLNFVRVINGGISYSSPTISVNAGTYLFVWSVLVQQSLGGGSNFVVSLIDLSNTANPIATSGVVIQLSDVVGTVSGSTVVTFGASTNLQLRNESGGIINIPLATGSSTANQFASSMTIVRLA